ncbi:MAG TPA: helix-turn-helix transcriptional regulator [Burkholderiaceae bacterium]
MTAHHDSVYRPVVPDERDVEALPVVTKATDYPAGHVIELHHHARGQLVYAEHGVMMVGSEGGQWIVPPTRAIWMPPGVSHHIRCIGVVRMRSLYVRPDAARHLPANAQAVGVSGLLAELIRAAMKVPLPYDPDTRDGRLMRLLLDELHTLPALPLYLPQPADARLRRICTRIAERPDDTSTLADWATALGIDVKTIQRLFARETGMTFGQWRQQARLLHGLERLAVGDKVVDVALALGYDSPSAFAAMFKRQFGEPPGAFYR